MTTTGTHDHADRVHADRVHAAAAVAVSAVVLLGFLVGLALLASQVVELVRWAAGD